jgi:hypothetical protein
LFLSIDLWCCPWWSTDSSILLFDVRLIRLDLITYRITGSSTTGFPTRILSHFAFRPKFRPWEQQVGAFVPLNAGAKHGSQTAPLRMAGPPYSGPAVKPILDSVNYPSDMKRLDMRQLKQVSEHITKSRGDATRWISYGSVTFSLQTSFDGKYLNQFRKLAGILVLRWVLLNLRLPCITFSICLKTI